ncbi:MAG: AEC family transporter [Verrucomicrobiota bacterium]|nr:AEC family transporter [Verrucomicrobiota bacterium]
MYKEIIVSIIELSAIIGLGMLARHLKYLKEEDLSHWSKLIIDFLFPCLIFSSITGNLKAERLHELWPMPFIGFGLMFFGAVVGIFLKKWVYSDSIELRNTFHHFCAINNYGFLPIVLVQNLLGPKALPLLFLLNLGSNFAFWTIGVGLLGGKIDKKTLKNIISPTLITLLCSLILVVTGLSSYVPRTFLNITNSAGNAAIPCMLMIIGASLYSALKIRDHIRDLIYISFLRLILIPMATILLLRLIPLPEDAYKIAYIVAIMPAAVSSTIIARRFGGDTNFAGQVSFYTTLLSIITIPAFMYFI